MGIGSLPKRKYLLPFSIISKQDNLGGYKMKVCSKCNKELDVSMFNKGKINKDGLNVWCKKCCSIAKKVYKEKHKEEIRLKDAIYRTHNAEILKVKSQRYRDKHKIVKVEPLIKEKTCRLCKNVYSADDTTYFYKKDSGKYGLGTICKGCFKKRSKQYYSDNAEHINEKTKQYYKDNLDNKKAYSKAFHKVYDKTEKGRNVKTVAWQKRRALELNLDNSLTNAQWEQIKKDFNCECAYCGKDKKLTIEHFIPISKLGEGTINNIIPACRSCNSSKRDNFFHEWYPNHKNYSKKREKTILKYLGYDKKIQQLSIL